MYQALRHTMIFRAAPALYDVRCLALPPSAETLDDRETIHLKSSCGRALVVLTSTGCLDTSQCFGSTACKTPFSLILFLLVGFTGVLSPLKQKDQAVGAVVGE